MKNKFLFTAICLLLVSAHATAQRDTLQRFPFIYCYNCPETGVYHDSINCAVKEQEWNIRVIQLNDTSFDPWNIPNHFAVYQHSEESLHAVGMAFGYHKSSGSDDGVFVGLSIELTLFDTSMFVQRQILTEPYNDNWQSWYVDSIYQTLTLPGQNYIQNYYYHFYDTNISNNSNHDTFLSVLKYAFFDEPIIITGGYYLGFSVFNHFNPDNPYDANSIPWIFEEHDPPYHFANSAVRLQYDKEWYNGATRYFPELFLIIEPECHEVESLRVATDSTGCITLDWDTLRWQTQWVLRLDGPDGTRYDTVDTCFHSYCGLNLGNHYEVSVRTQCYRPGGRNWSDWSDPVGIGTASIQDAETRNWKVELYPNPASGRVEVTSSLPMTRIEATDAQGRKVSEFRTPNSEFKVTLDVTPWPAGAYFLRILTPTGVTTKKLLVK